MHTRSSSAVPLIFICCSSEWVAPILYAFEGTRGGTICPSSRMWSQLCRSHKINSRLVRCCTVQVAAAAVATASVVSWLCDVEGHLCDFGFTYVSTTPMHWVEGVREVGMAFSLSWICLSHVANKKPPCNSRSILPTLTEAE